MAILQCTCGQSLTVPDNLAGRVGKCPKCGQKVRIPAPPADGTPGEVPVVTPIRTGGNSSAARSAGTASPEVGTVRARYQARMAANTQWRRNLVPIIAGTLILATIVIPWMAEHGKTVMSWKVISNLSGRDCSLLIGAWVIGAAAIAVSFCVRGLALRLSHVGMGLLGIILFWVAIGSGAKMASEGSFKTILMILPPGRPTGVILWWIWFLVVVCLIIAINLRLRLGIRYSIRVAVGVLAGGLAVWTIIRFFMIISDFTDMPKPYKDDMTLYLIAMLAAMVAVITACAIALVDVASLRADKKKLSRGAVRAVYGTLGVVVLVFSVIWPLHVADRPELILHMANSYAVIAGLLAIFVSGAVELTILLVGLSDARRGGAPVPAAGPVPTVAPVPTAPAAAAPAPTAEDLNARLGKLKALLDKGTISREEYDTERKRILADI